MFALASGNLMRSRVLHVGEGRHMVMVVKGLTLRPVGVESGISKFDLTWTVTRDQLFSCACMFPELLFPTYPRLQISLAENCHDKDRASRCPISNGLGRTDARLLSEGPCAD